MKGPRNSNSGGLVELRRERVARLSLRGLTVREIVYAIGRDLVNPKTGKAYSLGTIGNDLLVLQSRWMEQSMEAMQILRAHQMAELSEVKRAAWADKEYGAVLRALEREAKLLGLDEASKAEFELRDVDLTSMSNEQLEMLIEGVPLERVLLHRDQESESSG